MVRIINFKEKKNQDGDDFYILELQGDIEMVRSQTTGNFYATIKRAFVTSTFDKETCQRSIGQNLPGEIVKEECEPYDYTVEETGEVLSLQHRWVYSPVVKTPKTEETLQPKVKEFSDNGVMEFA